MKGAGFCVFAVNVLYRAELASYGFSTHLKHSLLLRAVNMNHLSIFVQGNSRIFL